MKSAQAVLTGTVIASLTACGGGDSGSSPSVSQVEATAIVKHVNSATIVLGDGAYLAGISIDILFGLSPATITSPLTKTCKGGGSYQVTYSKTSPLLYVKVGDSATINFLNCNYSGSKTSYSGKVAVQVSALGGTTTDPVQTYAINASAAQVNYVSSTANFLDVVDGAFSLTYSNKGATTTLASATGLSSTLSGYAANSSIVNGRYTLNSVSSSTTYAVGPNYTDTMAFSTPYTGADGVPHALSIATVTPVTWTSQPALAITTPGKFNITGYNGASLQVVNGSTTSATVSVDNGSDSTVDLSFVLNGLYLL